MNTIRIALIGIVCMGSLLAFKWTSPSVALEISVNLIAMLVTFGCILHVLREHLLKHKTEQRLKRKVLQKIYAHWPTLLEPKIVQAHLEQSLSRYGLEKRLKKLSRFLRNTNTLKRFVIRFKHLQAAEHVLKDLGLSWGPK